MMTVSYGGFSFQTGDPTLAVTKTILESALGDRIGYDERWTLTGELIGTSQSNVTQLINAMQDAFGVNFKNLIVYDNNGSPSAHALYNSKSFSGVKVKSLTFPDEPGQYVVSRKYQLTVEASFLEKNPGIVSYVETVTVRGGGPRWIYKPALQGPPQRQLLNEQTPYHATQSGQSMGFLDWIPAPAPLWPEALHIDQSSSVRKTPSFQNNKNVNFPTEWNYVFESATPFGNINPIIDI